MQVTEKIAAFRARMKDENFAAVIVPTADSHASEYIADYFKARQWLSGFTGSAGTLVIGEKEAALFVDGRYFIQAERQIAGSGITLMRMGTAGTPKLEEYLAALLHENDALGVDFGVVSEKFAENMRETAAKCGALLRDTGDWFGDLWKDRPPMPQEKAFILDEQYAGQSVQSKVSAIRKVMAERGAQLHVLNVLDDIAWVLNVRGGDVLNTPVVMSYLVIGQKHVNWFVDETKVDDAMRKTLADEGVNVRGYDEIIPALKGLEPNVKVLADESMMEIVFNNLISNAIKFTESGGRIILRQLKDGGDVVVTVGDTGCGMDEKTMSHIFDKFYQGDTSHSKEGNGLGLALVRRVLEIAGGTISVTSAPGEGSEFTVRLPYIEDERA